MAPPPLRRVIRTGVERLPARQDAPRHQHRHAYVTVVFAGAYRQDAYAGRLSIAAGDVVLQPTFDCHADRMLSQGVELLRLPWGREATLGGVLDGCPVDEIRRAAARDVAEAADMVAGLIAARPLRPRPMDHWSDELAAAIAADAGLQIGAWADAAGLSREGVCRGFRAHYGVNPGRFRGELRARAAWLRITGGEAPLAAIAHELGFADQSHMTRAVKWLTGAAPSAWRAAAAGA